MKRRIEIEAVGLPEDSELRGDSVITAGAVVGHGLVLRELGDGAFIVHKFDGARARLVGTFHNPGDALAALDELDLTG